MGTSIPTAMCAMSPVMWNSGAPPSTTSCGVRLIQSLKVQALNTTLPWVFIAPLGLPVVPEV